LGQKRAAEQRTADNFHFVRRQRISQRFDEWLDAALVGEKRIEVQPQFCVVSRLEPEVTMPSGDNIEKGGR